MLSVLFVFLCALCVWCVLCVWAKLPEIKLDDDDDTGLSVGAAWIAGQDRSMWRTLRPSAGQAQQ